MTINGGVGPCVRVLSDETREDYREPGRPRPVRGEAAAVFFTGHLVCRPA
ncbi:hypothetical protein [Streptomyces sp. NRRL F-5727]|nr:hypothetical protein [Streptomyces sp. NRRL F-5727]